MRTFLRSTVVAALAAWAGVASAQPAASAPMSGATSADARFVQDAGAGGAAEVAMGKMASQMASRDEVKQLGQRMVDDHTKAGDELKQIATGKGMTPPDAPTPAQQKAADRVGKLKGASFDKAYLAQQVSDHQKTIALFQREARSGRDPELKAFAAKTLPTLQEHLAMVRSLQARGGAPMSGQHAPAAASTPR